MAIEWIDFADTNAAEVQRFFGTGRTFRVSRRVWDVAEIAINHPNAVSPRGLPALIRWDLIFMAKMMVAPEIEPLLGRYEDARELCSEAQGFGMFIPTHPHISDDGEREVMQSQLFFRFDRERVVSIVTWEDIMEGVPGIPRPLTRV